MAACRKLRAFKRWMKYQGMDCSDSLDLVLHPFPGTDSPAAFSVSVRALRDLDEGDVVARIPKHSCLTIKNSGARHLIEDAGLDGFLGLAVAVMYERSLGPQSPWFDYLQLMPFYEPIPLLWSDDEIDSLLAGTELHKTIKEDKVLIFEDWKECIEPLLISAPVELNQQFFGVEHYFASRSLIASRSFQIDDFHGSGMVPLADLFNHKTGAEDVHFTSLVQHESDQSGESDLEDEGCDNLMNDELSSQKPVSGNESNSTAEFECSTSSDDLTILEMIMVKDVMAKNEVFNTYGSLGNAALLHRYGFAETNNPFDIVNIDLELVEEWSSFLYSRRYSRRRLSLWRRLDCSAGVGQDPEYFEISFHGEPQVELLVLLYIMLLPEEDYNKLDLAISSTNNAHTSVILSLSGKVNVDVSKNLELSRDFLLTKGVCTGLLSLADIREGLYGPSTLEDDIEALKQCCNIKEPKLYHSLVLRISERSILQKLRSYAITAAESLKSRS
ncbi:OLC1v1008495C1 [Oldenlandia corymbosa var. corymbosa]|uniref:N-lysine methyltransferase n=1 Tax=Oldenlandia corymbosa var. corymbosa TaxID=529605 RepID=A0AAV1DM32_OLDCO|nr:OLC1v1008495C1 [Oldenlandia corymbosa var. corymbosa]